MPKLCPACNTYVDRSSRGDKECRFCGNRTPTKELQRRTASTDFETRSEKNGLKFLYRVPKEVYHQPVRIFELEI
jgi:hypothetical protein